MNKKQFCLLTCLLCMGGLSGHADTILKLTFDQMRGTDGRALEAYRVTKGDVLPKGVDVVRVPDARGIGPAVVASDGFQGGQALVVDTTEETIHQGFFIPRNLPRFPGAPNGGAFQDVTGLTLEVILCIDRLNQGPRSLAGQWALLGQWGSGGMQPSLDLRNSADGALNASFSVCGVILDCPLPDTFLKKWHHLAGVISVVNDRYMLEIFLDGKSIGRKEAARPGTRHASMFVPYGGFAIGTCSICAENPSYGSRTPTGKIDAVAVSMDALDPATFVLPTGAKQGRR